MTVSDGIGGRVRRVAGVLKERLPAGEPVPVLFDSPHSGRTIPDDFVTAVSLADLRTGEDAFVDDLVSGCLDHGIGLIAAEFPRTYIDVNRAVDDIDESLLSEPWPGGANPTDKSVRGMGLIRREILSGVPIYMAPLSVAEVTARIETYYRPYHAAVKERLDRLHAAHGAVWHVDWHSMKPVGVAMNVDAGEARPDFVVSDGDGLTAAPDLVETVAGWLRERGYSASVNAPYKGAEMIRRYGAPELGRHSIQIEINRRLYLDADRMLRTEGFAELKRDLDAFSAWLAEHVRDAAGQLS
ncbi:MAG: N-formylglutamate amidohydrolase [Nisaea sp.]|uniref:N-formylglutamate amidohydrolase n=1 Tax=Nisaea sp. TaxID=2024842 RepID=UPI001B214F79|nr:N-formylglutamate amidohydrolase [Nisaea sp.]MBO6560033.1 N-formylglutamate amidohydrolase [Nisaea sp.]